MKTRALSFLCLMLPALAACSTSALAATPYKDITSSGPLTHVYIGNELSCQIAHTGDSSLELYPPDTIPGDCGTLAAVNGALYAPDFESHGRSAAGAIGTFTPFTPVSQSAVTGTGTGANPFKVVTVADVGSTGVRITEADTYVTGEESYRTDIAVANSGSANQNVIVYRAGDCFLQDNDTGFGSVHTATGEVACTTGAAAGSRIEQWSPIVSGSHFYEAIYSDVWTQIGSKQSFADTCLCTTQVDNGAGLSWSSSVPAGGSITRSHLTTFSPLGHFPLSTAKTADAASATAGSSDGYTITISNPNPISVTLSSISDTLPAGFTYSAGSTSGATSSNPAVSGRVLTWSGPLTVPAASGGTPGTISLHFRATVSSTAGDYFNSAGANSADYTITPTGDTAKVTVTPAPNATVTVKKVCPNGPSASSDRFQMIDNANGGADVGSALACGGQFDRSLAPGTAFDFNEKAGATTPPTDLAKYGNTRSASCTSISGLHGGESATCTITNTYTPTGMLTVIKHVVNSGGGSAVAGDWTIKACNSAFVCTGPFPGAEAPGTTNTLPAPVNGFPFVISESGGPSGYVASFSGDCTSAGEVTLVAGQNKTCTITNTYAGGSSSALHEGFEGGAAGWTLTGFWHVQNHPETISVLAPDINPDLVTLPDAGQLPTAIEGTHSAWYGEPSTGTYCGAISLTFQQPPKEGCASVNDQDIGTPNKGDLVSPPFSLAGTTSAVLHFDAWFEIEAVNADQFDLMKVQYTTDGGSSWHDLGLLNPPDNPAGAQDQSYSNAGLGQSPAWFKYTADLSAAAGQPSVRVRFEFDTVDENYNGFRGLLIDNVDVATVYEEPAPSISGIAPSCATRGITNPIVLTGSNFTLGSTVEIDGVSRPTSELSPERIEFLASDLGQGSHQVIVRTPHGATSNAVTLTIPCPPPPPPPPPPGPSVQGNASRPPAPVRGKTANLGQEKGVILIKRRGAGGFVPLGDLEQVPIGSIIDARKGVAQITTTGRGGRLQSLLLEGGLVKLSQSRDALVNLVLSAGNFRVCHGKTGSGRSVIASKHFRTIRRIFVNGKTGKTGKTGFRTTGRYSSTTAAPGTITLVQDRCDGTRTDVEAGRVAVRDLHRNRTVDVTTNHWVVVPGKSSGREIVHRGGVVPSPGFGPLPPPGSASPYSW
jgi:uncharacterized repeat protein (TIGR01451 family)